MINIPDHAALTKSAAALAKRAVEDLSSITDHQTLDDGREVLRREDGAKLQYLVTKERMGDAYTVIVDTDYNLPEGKAGRQQEINHLQIVFEDELTKQLYDEKIVPWAVQHQAQ